MEGDDRAWLYRVTLNLCRDEFRRRSRAPQLAEDPTGPMEVVDPEPGADTRSEQRQRKRLLEACLMELSERERMAIVLRDIEELGTRETALGDGGQRGNGTNAGGSGAIEARESQ